MNSKLITAPVDEPLTIAEARMHLRNPEITTNDAEILFFIKAAREHVEHECQRALLTQTWEAYLDEFPSVCGYDYRNTGESIVLPYPPLQSVTSITYTDTNNVAQTLSSSAYVVNLTGLFGQIDLVYGGSWPSTLDKINAVTIRFVAGWTHPDLIPESIKQWMKLYLTTLDQFRTPVVEGHIVQEIPRMFFDGLLDAHRIVRL